MPTLHGITVSIHSHFDQTQHPEFPDPDSSSGNLRPLFLNSLSTPPIVDFNHGSQNCLATSVYIPSISAGRFFIKYTVYPPYDPGLHFFFKMSMNGHRIASWGINPRLIPRGQVTRALFEADDVWDPETKKVIFKNNQIESRTFMFAPQNTKQSLAYEGGTIEVSVCRSRGKKRCHPEAEKFRPQERYGLMFPSSGLVASPAEDARLYDWILIDPKDEPYAAFRFHYRSWDSLQSLHIVPRAHDRQMLPLSPSFGTLTEYMAKSSPGATNSNDTGELEDNAMDASFASFQNEKIDETRRKLSGILKHTKYPPQPGNQQHGTPPRSNERKFASTCSTDDTSVSKFKESTPHDLNNWLKGRPLPLPPDYHDTAHFRKASDSSLASSAAVSVTRSLLGWVDSGTESRTTSPDPHVGVATVLRAARFSRSRNKQQSGESGESFGKAVFSLRNNSDCQSQTYQQITGAIVTLATTKNGKSSDTSSLYSQENEGVDDGDDDEYALDQFPYEVFSSNRPALSPKTDRDSLSATNEYIQTSTNDSAQRPSGYLTDAAISLHKPYSSHADIVGGNSFCRPEPEINPDTPIKNHRGLTRSTKFHNHERKGKDNRRNTKNDYESDEEDSEGYDDETASSPRQLYIRCGSDSAPQCANIAPVTYGARLSDNYDIADQQAYAAVPDSVQRHSDLELIPPGAWPAVEAKNQEQDGSMAGGWI